MDINEETMGKVVICQENANKLGVQSGSQVEVINPDNDKKTVGTVEVSDTVLDFAGQFSRDIVDMLQFGGIEIIVRPSLAGVSMMPAVAAPVPRPTPVPAPAPQPMSQPMTAPIPAPQPMPQPMTAPTSAPQPMPQPMSAPQPMPRLSPPPGMALPPRPAMAPTPAPMPVASEIPLDPYPNRIDVYALQSQKSGTILNPVVDGSIIGGRIQLSSNNISRLGLGAGMLVGWEDPLTRAVGSARIDQAPISDTDIRMSLDTKEDTNIQSDQIVVYSTEPPVIKTSEMMLEVQSQPNLNGYCRVSPRTRHSLSINDTDVLAFEDELTGAVGAGKVQFSEAVLDNAIVIDSEILEASGIGSFEVKVSKNRRQIIPLQSVALGITPISGENMWEIISTARTNVESLKGWLANYIIFKGIKLRWGAVNIACSIVDCVPDLSGDILAQITPNTTLTLSPLGLIPFNAILILDISRSMMARDVLVTNIAPAIEGIKAAMESREIQEFLVQFKDGVNVPRRISAAFAAVLFLSEKVGRGFGEKVSVIRFADEAQLIPFGDSYYMDSASGKKGILEEAARMIVDRIGNAYGQATNMGQAMLKAHEVLFSFEQINPDQPTMIVILTDGVPTDPDDFFESIRQFSENPNVVIYIVGLGNPDDNMMTRAAALCGGEYFKPENAGDLLVWYSKRARDLTVKLKAHK